MIVAHTARRASCWLGGPAGWTLIVGADGLCTGPSRDGFALGGLGAPVGCVNARLTSAGWGLSGAGAECKGDVPRGVEVRRGGRQVQDDAADRADDVRAELEEPVAQPRHLGAGTGGARRAQPEFLQCQRSRDSAIFTSWK